MLIYRSKSDFSRVNTLKLTKVFGRINRFYFSVFLFYRSVRNVEAGRLSPLTRLARVKGCQAYLTTQGAVTLGEVTITLSSSIKALAG